MCGKIVSLVEAAFVPIDAELALVDMVTYLVNMHANGLAVLLSDRVIWDVSGHAIICRNWCGWLGMAHFCDEGNLE